MTEMFSHLLLNVHMYDCPCSCCRRSEYILSVIPDEKLRDKSTRLILGTAPTFIMLLYSAAARGGSPGEDGYSSPIPVSAITYSLIDDVGMSALHILI